MQRNDEIYERRHHNAGYYFVHANSRLALSVRGNFIVKHLNVLCWHFISFRLHVEESVMMKHRSNKISIAFRSVEVTDFMIFHMKLQLTNQIHIHNHNKAFVSMRKAGVDGREDVRRGKRRKRTKRIFESRQWSRGTSLFQIKRRPPAEITASFFFHSILPSLSALTVFSNFRDSTYFSCLASILTTT